MSKGEPICWVCIWGVPLAIADADEFGVTSAWGVGPLGTGLFINHLGHPENTTEQVYKVTVVVQFFSLGVIMFALDCSLQSQLGLTFSLVVFKIVL